MRKQWKGFVAGVLATVMMLGTIGTAAATVGKKAVEVDYNNIKVTMNGAPVNLVDANGNAVEPFSINGTTYLPVRAVAGALGLGVDWDGATSTVKLTSGGAQVSGQQAQTSTESFSRNSPAPIGTAQSIQIDNWTEKYNASVVILEATRGAAAYNMLKEANQFNSPAEEGMEYIVVKARVSINSVSEDKAIHLSEYSFDAYSSDNVEYDTVIAVDPSPEFSGNVFAGGTLEGYFTVQVSQSDKAPKVVFGSNYDGSGGIWFSLTSEKN